MALTIVILAALPACTSITLRPSYRPSPAAAYDTMTVKPPEVIAFAGEELVRLGLTVRVNAPAEGYLESRWYDLARKRSRAEVADPERTVRIRVWADLVTPLQTQVVIEPAQRRSLDPSVGEREGETVARPNTPADSLARALRAAIRKRFGREQEAGPAEGRTGG